MLKFKNVAVAISGGVDSAVAAFLLKFKGFTVKGVFMQNWDITDETGICSVESDYQDALHVCNELNIPLIRVNFVKEYWNEVFCPILREYETGFTPNPDILCNRHIKFNHFHNFAMNDLKVDAIATGHYAKTSFGPYLEHYNPGLGVKLLLAKDKRKDQTFFLCQIRQKSLQNTMFPLCDITKSEVKQIAISAGLTKIAEKPESMGICFIGSRDFQDFVQEYVPDKIGDFVNLDTAQIIGQHSGVHKWTLGQRARLSGSSKPYFIAKKDVAKNIIYVAPGSDHPILYTDLFSTSPPHWIHSQPEELAAHNVLQCDFKFQHTQFWEPCEIVENECGLIVHLKNPKRAVTSGQYAVFSKHGECFGSAKIINTGVSYFSYSYFQKHTLDKNTRVENS